MNRLQSYLSLILMALIAILPAAAADRWAIQFFHDVLEENFTIMDLKFPSPERGVAAGYVTRNGKSKPMSVVTNDGGKTWDYVKIQDEGLSLFFLNENIGWMVTEGALWKTVEAGRSWEKVSGIDEMQRVAFLNEKVGWAVGTEKSVWETRDGGENWNLLPAAAEPPTSDEHTSYIWIDVAPPNRVTITGYSERPRGNSMLPDWMNPEQAIQRRQWPTSTIVLQSVDGGASWHSSVTSMFGRVVRLRIDRDGVGLSLVQFQHGFDWPAEVYLVDTNSKETKRTYRAKNHVITDVMLTDNRVGWLVGAEQPGKLPGNPIPGKLIALKSSNLVDWRMTEVEYRARARRAVLAHAGDGHLWIGTDTGLILKLISDTAAEEPGN